MVMGVETSEWNVLDYLETPEDRAEFLNAAIEANDPAYLQEALGLLARAEGMSKVAKRSGMNRESLYRSLSTDGNPAFSTVLRVIDALGLSMAIHPKAGS